MNIGKWFHQLFNPHCEHCKEEADTIRDEKHHCDSCETLKAQLALLNQERNRLLSNILKEPERIEMHVNKDIKPPTAIPWRVRQQMLEKEDRAKAAAMRDAAKPDSFNKSDTVVVKKQSTEELEKELNVASEVRESEAG